jgi:hypothetical protein
VRLPDTSVAPGGRAWFLTVMSQGKAEQRAAREARLEKALRENLRRRKAQARGRGAEERDAGEDDAARSQQETVSSPSRRR